MAFRGMQICTEQIAEMLQCKWVVCPHASLRPSLSLAPPPMQYTRPPTARCGTAIASVFDGEAAHVKNLDIKLCR